MMLIESYVDLFWLIILITTCLYIIVNRICRCFETCHTAKAFEKFMENGGEEPEDLG